MSRKNRQQLKERFRKGCVPGEDDFSDLLDSMVNAIEEGFDRTPEDGLRIAQLQGQGKLLSFYEDLAVEAPRWFQELEELEGEDGAGRSFLHWSTPELENDGRHALTLSTRRKGEGERLDVSVGIDTAHPRWELDVAGVVASHGRKGRDVVPVPADGAWHDLTGVLSGCNAYEVVAGIGAEDSVGRYALLHAFALNAFGSRNDVVDARQAWFGGRSSRIELRWKAMPEEDRFAYRLELRVDPDYGEKAFVRCQITKLWFDPLLDGTVDADSP